MMDQHKIDRINELARLARERELTPEEVAQRTALRTEYVEAMKASLVSQLERTYLVDEKGNKTKLTKRQ